MEGFDKVNHQALISKVEEDIYDTVWPIIGDIFHFMSNNLTFSLRQQIDVLI